MVPQSVPEDSGQRPTRVCNGYRPLCSLRPALLLDWNHSVASRNVRLMMRRRIHLINGLFCFLTLVLPCFAQTQDDLFNGDILHEVRIYINPEDLATMKRNIDICPMQDLDALEGQRVPNEPR